MRIRVLAAAAALATAFLSACTGEAPPAKADAKRQVVVYTALDREFSEPILKAFETKTGIAVKPVYDTEASKTVGLVNRLIAERARPACDVFWNNEIVRSIQLKREGLTQKYDVASAADIPVELKDPDGHWVGFAARARVIAVNTTILPDESAWPRRVADLADAKWKGRAAFAKPLFGTTSTHAAILWARDGEPSLDFWRGAYANAVAVAGNAQARDAAADGEVAWCLTDTDDAFGAIQDGKPLRIVYPDAAEGQEGLVLIPNTLAMIADCPHPDEALALIDYLLSREVEDALAKSRSAQIPVRAGIDPPAGLEPIAGLKIMPVDWEKVADALAPCQAALVPIAE